jgi:hypothetical protein
MFTSSFLEREDRPANQWRTGKAREKVYAFTYVTIRFSNYTCHIGWRGNFVLSAAEQWLKLELTKNFKLIRDLELLPPLLGQDWSSVFLQRFEGSVTYVLIGYDP